MIPNKFQQAVFDHVKSVIQCKVLGKSPQEYMNKPTFHAVVEAVAGSGKTTTIVQALELIPKNQSVIFMAFGKEIATELSKRVPSNTMATTFHSLGFRTLIKNVGRVNLNNDKIYQNYFPLMEDEFTDLSNEEVKSMFSPVKQLTSLLKGNMNDVTEECVEFLIEKHNIDVEAPTNLLTTILKRLLTIDLMQTANIDFDDMIWMPIKLGLEFQKFDFVFVDEAQDLSPTQINIIKKCLKSDGCMIAVGDRYQSIYGFRGADSEAIPNIIEAMSATILPLSITYRCPLSHVRLAQTFVPEIEAAPHAEEGILKTINFGQMIDTISPGDMALCRYNAPLVKPAFALLKEGIKVTIKGRDIGAGLVTLIKKLRPINIDDLIDKLGTWRQIEIKKAKAKNKSIESIEDKVDVILAFVDNVKDVPELIRFISELFSDKNSAIVFSSIHKAKGLEANNVFVIQPQLMPSKYAVKDWENRQEQNIQYVAFTRGKKSLYMVE